MVRVFFSDISTGNPLWSDTLVVAPRVGETLSYSFEPHDRPQWDGEAALARDSLSGSDWEVVAINHLVRTLFVNEPAVHIVYALLRARTGPKEGRTWLLEG